VPLIGSGGARLVPIGFCVDARGARRQVIGEKARVTRVPFYREVKDERDARSTLTMLAQLAWERERNYVPVMPQLPATD
jgi:hypothetical protein